jgi:hypothetical protein
LDTVTVAKHIASVIETHEILVALKARIDGGGVTQADAAVVINAERTVISKLLSGVRSLKHDEAVALVRWLGLADHPRAAVMPNEDGLLAALKLVHSNAPTQKEALEDWLRASAKAMISWLEEHRDDPGSLDDPRHSARAMRLLMRQSGQRPN